MNPESLLASAAINIGLALVILSLYSVCRKHPSNADIYFARRLPLSHSIAFDRSFTFRRLLPSLDWIRRAVRVTEDEIFESSGLDALIIIRLFKFGINFFIVASVVGLLVLLPLNYTSSSRVSSSSESMDSFTISGITNGSNWLWVHFSSLCFLSVYALYLLHKGYNYVLVKRIQRLQVLRHQPNQFTVLVRGVPLCNEHKMYSCCVDHFFSKYHPQAYQSYQILYHGKAIEDLLNQAKSIAMKIEDLRNCSLTKKHVKRPSLSDSLLGDDEIVCQEKVLQEFCSKIQHLRGEKMLETKELPVAFVTFRSRWGAALAAQTQQHSNPVLWITDMAPEPRDVLWSNLGIPYRHLRLYKAGVYVLVTLLTVFFAIPVTAVQGIAKFEKLSKWFPPAMAMQLIPGVRSIVTGYLPSVILSGFIYIVPFAMIAMAKIGGYVSRSRKDIKACNMFFYFLVGNVFFLSLLSGSLLDQIGKSFIHPGDIPNRLASAVTAQADFFTTYILTSGFSGFSLEILQPGLLMWDTIRLHTWGRGRENNPYLYSFPFYRVIPFVALFILIGMVYAVVSPLLLPFLICYFLLGYIVFINQIQDVYETTYETCGQYWPYIHHYVIVAIVIMQITMIGLFGLKSKPSASIATVPLVILTLAFNEYCKIRFLPTFNNYSIQYVFICLYVLIEVFRSLVTVNFDLGSVVRLKTKGIQDIRVSLLDAKDSDELDEKNGLTECAYQDPLVAYCPPLLRPLSFAAEGSSSTDRLLSST